MPYEARKEPPSYRGDGWEVIDTDNSDDLLMGALTEEEARTVAQRMNG
jgi:hypothetical protein